MTKIQFCLCGNAGPWDDFNPYKVTKNQKQQQILCLINHKPMSMEQILNTLEVSYSELATYLNLLQNCSLVKIVTMGGTKYYMPNFTIFNVGDQRTLIPLIRALAEKVAIIIEENIVKAQKSYEICGFNKQGFLFDDLSYIILGAYTLDFGGLQALKREKLLRVAKKMPGDREYIFSGLEGEIFDLTAGWKWGHVDCFDSVYFYSHGELPSKGIRQAFPDIAWQWVKEKKRTRKEVDTIMKKIGKILVILCEAPKWLDEISKQTNISTKELEYYIELLLKIGYIKKENDKFKTTIPVIKKNSAEEIKNLAKHLMGRIITQIFRPRWHKLKQLYKETSPAKNGIDIKEAFNVLYHLIFEQSLEILIKTKKIPSPPIHSDRAKYAVWLSEVKAI